MEPMAAQESPRSGAETASSVGDGPTGTEMLRREADPDDHTVVVGLVGAAVVKGGHLAVGEAPQHDLPLVDHDPRGEGAELIGAEHVIPAGHLQQDARPGRQRFRHRS